MVVVTLLRVTILPVHRVQISVNRELQCTKQRQWLKTITPWVQMGSGIWASQTPLRQGLRIQNIHPHGKTECWESS